jgi:hypothetical protein
MTITETRTNQQIRREWLDEITQAVDLYQDPVLMRALLALVRSEGPALADDRNQWWPRRFRWIDLQMEAGVMSVEMILIRALFDMNFANEHNGR